MGINQYYSKEIKKFVRQPITCALALLTACALMGIPYSPEPFYSLRVFLEEFFLNLLLFVIVAAYTMRNRMDWINPLTVAGILFPLLYLGIMAQWVVMPDTPLFMKPDSHIATDSATGLIFNFGNACSMFHGIHHTSLFLELLIAFWCVRASAGEINWKTCSLLLLNLVTLITTTRRAATISTVCGMALAMLFYNRAKTVFACVSVAILCIFILISATCNTGYFIRENWHLILEGNIQAAQREGGSIPLRVSTYKAFIAEILRCPFCPRGLGKRLIKEYRPDLVKQAGLQHGHNTLINFAYYMGIQGSFALVLVILAQVRLYIRYWKKSNHEDKMLMACALIFLFMFWGTNMFTDGFRHGSATLYWLFTAVPTGVALRS